MTATDIDYSDTVCTLSADEQRVAQMLGDAWNQYLKLPIEHPCERDELLPSNSCMPEHCIGSPGSPWVSKQGAGIPEINT